MENIAGRLVRGSAWIAGARVIVNLLGFVSTIVLARILVPADFGLVALGTTVLAIVNSITDMSLAQALVRHEQPTDHHFHTAWTLGVIRGAVLGGIVAALGFPMSTIYGDDRLLPIMAVLGLSSFLSGFANPKRVLLNRQLIFWQDFLLSVSQRLVAVVVSIAIALIYKSYWALVIGTVVGQLVADLLSYTTYTYMPRLALRHARELWSFSIWLTLGQAISTINWRFDQLLVGNLLGKANLGLYTVGDNLAQIPTREATQPLTRTLYPAYARVARDVPRLREAYNRSQAVVTAVALPAGVGMAVIARPLVELAMGDKWLPAVAIIQALAAIFAAQTLGSLVAPLAMAAGQPKQLFKRDVRMFLIRVPIIVTGTALFGLTGLLVARALAGLVAMVMNMTLIRSILDLPVTAQIRHNWRAMTAVAFMAATAVLVQSAVPASLPHTARLLASITSAIVAGAATYIGVSVALWKASGSPDGPEREVMRLGVAALSRFQRVETSR